MQLTSKHKIDPSVCGTEFDASVQELRQQLELMPAFKFDNVYGSKVKDSKRKVIMNETEILQLLWAKKHHVTGDCIRDFYYLARHPRFNKDLVVSASTLKRRVACLPTDPTYGITVENDESEIDEETGESAVCVCVLEGQNQASATDSEDTRKTSNL